MNLIALVQARNEAWVIGYSLRALLGWCDQACVLLHRCEDATAEIVATIAAEHPRRVHIVVDDAEEWLEVDQKQRLLTEARARGATHCAMVDADEVLSGNVLQRVRDGAQALSPGGVLFLPWLQLWRSLDQMDCLSREIPVVFADAEHIEFHARAGYQKHARHQPWTGIRKRMAKGAVGGLMHLQRINWRRSVARTVSRKIDEALRWPKMRGIKGIERYYEKLLDDPKRLVPVPQEWWSTGVDRSLIDADEEPWEIKEILVAVERYGIERFDGLNLHGIEAEAR